MENRITFLNGDQELKDRGLQHLQGRKQDFETFTNLEDYENPENENDVGSFYDYGLSIDYVAPGTFADENEGYLRYQLSWGGPGDEVRFYFTFGANKCYRIEYVFLDWGTGIGFDVTSEDWAEWLWEWFYDSETATHEYNKAFEEI